MATNSWPAVGVGGFSESRWGDFFEDANGIVGDFDGKSFALTLIADGNLARYSPGTIRVGGYMLRITTADHDIPISPDAGTYWTWACYDPALNVAGGGGLASGSGPCVLGVSPGLPSTAGGKQYALLDKIVRTSGALTSAVVTSQRVWVGPSLQIVKLPPEFNPNAAEWAPNLTHHAYPLGTTLYVQDTATTYHRAMDGASIIWRAGASGWQPFPNNSPLVAATADGSPRYRLESGGVVRLRGTLKRSNNTALTSGTDVVLGTMPAGARPPAGTLHRWVSFAKPATGRGMAVGEVASNGVVTLYGPSSGSLDWVDLSGITYATR